MAQSSREIVERTICFEYPERLPQEQWVLPWANIHYPKDLKRIKDRFPADIEMVRYNHSSSKRKKGDEYKIGYYTDEWGCTFKTLQNGIVGEVESPILTDINDWKTIKPPYELLPGDSPDAIKKINRLYDQTNKFVLANICPRPWERYQFIRGTENAMMDIMFPDEGALDLINVIHDFYLAEVELWAKSNVDAICFMDDWGAQNQLLIRPQIWREIFKPLYREYCEIAKAHKKYVFMHSDGFISEIYPDLIEIGVDVLNSQLFCMDFDEIEKIAKGKITFWGEIDRQHVLRSKNPQDGRDAVRKVAQHLYDPSGGIIAQCEVGAGTNPDTAYAVFEEWEKVHSESSAGKNKK
jgi:uroporphyrinogen decarboxylase